ncbi:MAG: N-acetyltransferase [Opitutaceae bacterium]|nr:N-acetyltransferase [Opitutaceae bacterium]
MIRAATTADAAAIAAIYNHYVENTVVTFEEEPIGRREMARRIREISARLPFLVAVEDREVVGYTYANSWKTRSAYRYSVESTVYLGPAHVGRGWGTQLYTILLAELRQRGCHAVIGGVSLPNAASVALHEKMGFAKVAHFPEVGRKFGRWIDVGYWTVVL